MLVLAKKIIAHLYAEVMLRKSCEEIDNFFLECKELSEIKPENNDICCPWDID